MNLFDRPECSHIPNHERRLISSYLKINPLTILGPPQAAIVGEMPPRGRKGVDPFFPYPPGSQGSKLLKVSGLTPGQYLGRFHRVNLIGEFMDDPEKINSVVTEAVTSLKKIFPNKHRVILCGTNVSPLFGVKQFFTQEVIDEVTYIAIPHPSNEFRAYSDPTVRVALKAALQFAAGILTKAQRDEADRVLIAQGVV